MGAEFYFYVTPFEQEPRQALAALRARVFSLGEFDAQGQTPASAEEAVTLAGSNGTRSILDIDRIESVSELGAADPFTDDERLAFFGSLEPTLEAVRASLAAADVIERGSARFVPVFESGRRVAYVFMGYSWD